MNSATMMATKNPSNNNISTHSPIVMTPLSVGLAVPATSQPIVIKPLTMEYESCSDNNYQPMIDVHALIPGANLNSPQILSSSPHQTPHLQTLNTPHNICDHIYLPTEHSTVHADFITPTTTPTTTPTSPTLSTTTITNTPITTEPITTTGIGPHMSIASSALSGTIDHIDVSDVDNELLLSRSDIDKGVWDAYNILAQEANDFEVTSVNAYERVRQCKNNPEAIAELLDYLSDKYYCIRTKNVKYPRTLMQFIVGCESIHPDIIHAISMAHPTTRGEDFILSHHKQYLYNCIKGNKRAIQRIRMVMGDYFDSNYTYNGLNALKIAILSKQTIKFISYILGLEHAHHMLTYDTFNNSVYYYALHSPLCFKSGKISNNDALSKAMYVSILYELISITYPVEFIDHYFERKKNIIIGPEVMELFNDLEHVLVGDGIEYYFDQCVDPLAIAKIRCQQLKKQAARMQ